MSTRIMLGLIVIFVGLSLMADNFGYLHAERLFSYWPLLVLGFGVVKASQPGCGRGSRIVGATIAIGGLLLTAILFTQGPVPVDTVWALGIVVFGVSLLTRHMDWPARSSGAGAATIDGSTSAEPSGGIDESISGMAFWSAFKRRSTSPAFKRADLTAVMGGVDLDLRAATASPNGAVIEVFAMWGGIVIRVPPDWAVSNQVTAIMGGVDDRSSGVQDARNRLIIRGFVMMGGVEIKT